MRQEGICYLQAHLKEELLKQNARNWIHKALRPKVEAILLEFGVAFGKYHGRDLEGPAVSRLLKNSGELLPRIQSLLVDSCPLGNVEGAEP
mmetsp:Transcript_17306/g.26981  ORF Transcript_17306/g.26981 Transcript_17306/m.26981 type:complete len:91 (+) Transcript_17306:1892-2164(+)